MTGIGKLSIRRQIICLFLCTFDFVEVCNIKKILSSKKKILKLILLFLFYYLEAM